MKNNNKRKTSIYLLFFLVTILGLLFLLDIESNEKNTSLITIKNIDDNIYKVKKL